MYVIMVCAYPAAIFPRAGIVGWAALGWEMVDEGGGDWKGSQGQELP